MQGMRDDRDIQWPKPASAPEKGRGPLCGKDRRSATVCPCRCVPTCYSFPTKACQVACSTSHLTQNPGENVPGDTFLPSTWHDVHADVLAAGCNLNGEAHSFMPEAGRRKQGGEQAVWRQFGGSLNKTPFAAIMMAGYHVSGR